MVQSPSWEANWFAASQEIPRILWNPKVHHRTHKRPPPVPILCQPNPVTGEEHNKQYVEIGEGSITVILTTHAISFRVRSVASTKDCNECLKM